MDKRHAHTLYIDLFHIFPHLNRNLLPIDMPQSEFVHIILETGAFVQEMLLDDLIPYVEVHDDVLTVSEHIGFGFLIELKDNISGNPAI
jgi:hypothetical protein